MKTYNNSVEVTMRTRTILIFLIFSIFQLHAGTISVTDVESSSTLSGFGLNHDLLVDGSGLTNDQHGNALNTMWLTVTNDPDPFVYFDLGAVYSISNIQIWNYNQSVAETDRCVQNLTIKYGSTNTFGYDSSFPSTLVEISSLPQASGLATESGNLFDSFTPFEARFILFDISSSYGDNEYGLSEVKFSGDFVRNVTDPHIEITGVSIESFSSEFGGRPASATISGDQNILGHHSTSTGQMWLSNNEELPEIVYDLGEKHSISAIEVWNYNEGAFTNTNRGINGVDILGSDDGISFSLISSTTFTEAPGLSDSDFSQLLTFNFSARYIKLDVTSDHGGDNYTGLSEIKFYTSSFRPQPKGTIFRID